MVFLLIALIMSIFDTFVDNDISYFVSIVIGGAISNYRTVININAIPKYIRKVLFESM